MKTIIFFFSLFLSVTISSAQTSTCSVALDSLKGTYEGECKNGKAEGFGKATGADNYEGMFKNGLPEGTGTYKWQNGDWFIGTWKKGLMEGKGEYYSKVLNSSKHGFWKKNIYKGEYEKPYELFNLNSLVRHSDFASLSKKVNSITVSMQSGISYQANVNDFQVLAGSYVRENKREVAKTSVIEFQQVEFPFHVKFTVRGSPFEFEIYEAGEWLVNVELE